MGTRPGTDVASAISTLLVAVGVVLVVASGLIVGFTDTPTRAVPDGGRPGNLPGIGGVAMTFLLVTVAALVVAADIRCGAGLRHPGAEAGAGQPGRRVPAVRLRDDRVAARLDRRLSRRRIRRRVPLRRTGCGEQRLVPAADVSITPILQRVAYAWGLTVIEIAVLGRLVVGLMMARRARFAAVARTMFTHRTEDREGLPEEWARRVGHAMFLARLKNLVPAVFTVFAVTGMMLSLVAGYEQLATDRPRVVDPLPSWLDSLVGWMSGLSVGGAGWLAWLGTWALTGLAAALLVLGRGAIRAENARRGINVVWDVVAFWPRKIHPFVPPPYSQQVVAGLRRRISWHLGELHDPTAEPPTRPATRVVVAAHSQGSLITVAALLWLTPAEARRVGLVTFGSQLQQQFARAFPAAVDVVLLRVLPDQLGSRWRNLYRDTDPIAGPVLSWRHRTVAEPDTAVSDNFDTPTNRDTVPPLSDRVDPPHGLRRCGPDWRLLDPVPADVGLMAAPVADLRGHSDYPADPSWAAAVQQVLPPLR